MKVGDGELFLAGADEVVPESLFHRRGVSTQIDASVLWPILRYRRKPQLNKVIAKPLAMTTIDFHLI